MILPLLASVALGSQPQNPIVLQHRYTVGDVDTYTLEMSGHAPQGEFKASTTLVFKVLKLTEAGAEVLTTSKDVKLTLNGKLDPDSGKTFEKTLRLDRHWMESGLTDADPQTPMFTTFAGYTPATAVAIGVEFPVTWKSDEDAFTLTGTGKLSGTETKSGEKLAVITFDLRLKPKDDQAAKLSFRSMISIATGKLVEADGRIELESPKGMSVIKIRRVAP